MPLFPGIVFVLIGDAPKQRRQRDGCNLHALRMLVEPQRVHQLVELLGQSGDGPLTPLQPGFLRRAGDAITQPFVGALYDLQRLAQVVPCHSEERCLKVARALELQSLVAGRHRHKVM